MSQRSLRRALFATAAVLTASLPAIGHADGGDLDGLTLKLRVPDAPGDAQSGDANLDGGTDGTSVTMPELGVSYLFTPTDGIELVLTPSAALGTQSESSILGDTSLDDPGSGDAGFGDLQPPSLVLQYQVDLSQGLKPYGGIGFNHGIAYSDQAPGGAVTDFKLDNGWGWALQAGVDYLLEDHWALNFDVKKIFVSPDAERKDGAVPTAIDVDPWVVGAGLAFRY